jgi:hypothetical protein
VEKNQEKGICKMKVTMTDGHPLFVYEECQISRLMDIHYLFMRSAKFQAAQLPALPLLPLCHGGERPLFSANKEHGL